MFKSLLRTATLLILICSCASSSRNKSTSDTAVNMNVAQVDIPADRVPAQLTDLARTEEGAFILAPGFYELDYKTYCLQPGTPDPSPRDAYLQGSITGYRKTIVESVLNNSRIKPEIPQRNVQLLLWSIVSGSDFNKLSPTVQSDAMKLLTPKQVFELKGGVLGAIKTISYNIPSGVIKGNDEVRRLFEVGSTSYEAIERMAVLREQSQLKRPDFKNDQWYKQGQNYYVRYFPVSYQKVKIQVYVPDGQVDSTGKVNGEYLIFDPTGFQAIPANSNAQRLGIGGPVIDIVRVIIKVSKDNPPARPVIKKQPEEKKNPKTST